MASSWSEIVIINCQLYLNIILILLHVGRHREDDITIPSTVSLWWSFPAKSSTVSTLSPHVVFVDEYREVKVLKRGLRGFILSICPSWRPKSELVCRWVWGILHVVCLFCGSSFCCNVHFVNNELFPLNLKFQKNLLCCIRKH